MEREHQPETKSFDYHDAQAAYAQDIENGNFKLRARILVKKYTGDDTIDRLDYLEQWDSPLGRIVKRVGYKQEQEQVNPDTTSELHGLKVIAGEQYDGILQDKWAEGVEHERNLYPDEM